MRILKNRTQPRIPHYLVLIWNNTKPGTTLIETVLNGDPCSSNSTAVVQKDIAKAFQIDKDRWVYSPLSKLDFKSKKILLDNFLGVYFKVSIIRPVSF